MSDLSKQWKETTMVSCDEPYAMWSYVLTALTTHMILIPLNTLNIVNPKRKSTNNLKIQTKFKEIL